MRILVVECYWPGMIEEDVRETLDRVRHLRRVPSSGRTPRSLGCIFVPSDGIALFLFEGSREAVVRHVGRLADVPFDRIVESALFGSSRSPT
jgi:hypothetical protein